MNASVVSITDRIRQRIAQPVSDAERARRMVRECLAQTDCQPERIRHAQNRVERSVSAGFGVDACVRRAVEWALSRDAAEPAPFVPQSRGIDPNDPPPRFAA